MKAVCYGRPFSFREGGLTYGNHENHAASCRQGPVSYTHLEIEVRLGATWIDKEYIQQFMYETFNTPFYLQRSIEVNYASFTAEWQIKGKSSVSYNDVAAYTTYGTRCV